MAYRDSAVRIRLAPFEDPRPGLGFLVFGAPSVEALMLPGAPA